MMIGRIQDNYDVIPAIYRTLRAFYDADPQRAPSGEADYGVHWRLTPWPHPWRVSYVHATGEVYAAHQELIFHDPAERTLAYGPVLIVGEIPPDHLDQSVYRRDRYYATLDRILQGWPDHCGKPNGLIWVRDRIRDHWEAARCSR